MDLHRCRFVPFQPGAIHHIASVSLGAEQKPLIAVARSDRRIELWRPLPTEDIPAQRTKSHRAYGAARTAHKKGSSGGTSWISHHTIHHAHTIEALCFATNADDDDLDGDDTEEINANAKVVPRLFVASLEGFLVEYSLETLQPLVNADSVGGGAIWCMQVSPCQRYLAIGCEDGCVRLFDIDGPPGTCSYLRCFDRQQGRIVCLAWTEQVDAQGNYMIFSGGADGLIRKWSLSSGRSTQRMCVGTAPSSDDDVLVWDIKCLSNGQVVSADSLGCVKFWDMKMCTLIQSFRCHASDVLALAVDQNSNAVFAAGIDSKISLLRITAGDEADNGKWILTQHRKLHTHDIRALCWLQQTPPTAAKLNNRLASGSQKQQQPSKNGSAISRDYLFSGGIDTLLTILPSPVDAFPQHSRQPTRVSAFPLVPIAKVCRKHRLVVSSTGDQVSVHRVGTVAAAQAAGIEAGLVATKGAKFLATVKVKAGMAIASVDVSRDGDWLVFVDNVGHVHVYKMKQTYDVAQGGIALVNFSSFLPEQVPCHVACLVGSDALCVATSTGQLVQYGLTPIDGHFPGIHRVPLFAKNKAASPILSSTCTLTASSCGRFVAAANSHNQCLIYDIEKQQCISVPQISNSRHTALHLANILTGGQRRQVMFMFMSSSTVEKFSTVRVFDLASRKFDTELEARFASLEWLRGRKEKVVGAVVTAANVLFMWSQRWLGRVELDSDVPATFTTRFDNILAFDLLSNDDENGAHLEAAIVERPWVEILESMQAPVVDQKYGI